MTMAPWQKKKKKKLTVHSNNNKHKARVIYVCQLIS